jgi:4'-phosphopantetheinyl transferase
MFDQECKWQRYSDRIEPIGEKIDIWRVCLKRDPLSVGTLFETLSPDERQKANKFHFARDRDHFVVARGSLRKILGWYINVSPSQISFFYNKYGKPFLVQENQSFQFNISHSNDLAVIAVTSGREVGLDIEFVNENLDVLSTVQSVFSETEISAFKALPPNLRTGAFFRGWTRKEAYIKALGKGFSYPLEQFKVSVMTDEPDISFRTYDHQKIRDWSLMSFGAQEEYMGAVVVEGKIGTIRYWQLIED